MAKNDQNESALPVPGQNNKITASDFLPRFFRTQANKKFLQGTLDQLIQPGVAEKINGYYGRTTAKAYKTSDNYVDDVTNNRTNYQLEPATVIKDVYDNVTFYKDYNDYIGQLDVFGANTDNHSRLNSQETYAWNPNIDWDKFVNFREYYWMPNGPVSIPVRGQSRDIVSTYTVTTEDQGDSIAYVFNDGLTRNPNLKLYRGQTYRFEIDAPGHPMAIAISRTFTPGTAILTAGTEGLRGDGLFGATLYGNEYDQGEFIILPSGGSVTFADDDNVSTLYPDGIRKLGEEGEEVAIAYIEKGTIEFTIPMNAPDRLYYISKNAVDTSGQMRIYDIEENAFLDVGNEVLGKKTYLSANGVQLSNGMKIKFQGDVLPAEYETNNWYVEGVGDKIKLVKDQDLTIPAAYSDTKRVAFDSDNFDTLPFGDASAYATKKDYVVVNRATPDRNAWSRYNRWHHRDVIQKSFDLNHLPRDLDESTRAKRPIIEFEAGLKLDNFGAVAKKDVDLIDTFTTDVFSSIEGQSGYNIDGINLADNMRILFTADTDVLVSGKIYQVKFVEINNTRQISLIETEDTTPIDLETVLVTQGVKNSGKSYHYHDNVWLPAQEKTTQNQAPLFEVCDTNKNSFSDTKFYPSTSFKGTKVFSYAEGEGTIDNELGFALEYKSINNTGDIVFNFNLLNDTFTYQTETDIFEQKINNGYLKKYTSLTNFNYVNGFSSTPTVSKQFVIREYSATDIKVNNFEIDVYNKSSSITDLKVAVFVNNKLQSNSNYTVDKTNENATIIFAKDLIVDDVIKIKTDSKTVKNSNGYYEFPYNLERNPLNDDINQFTLGEVIDHVDSMLEDIPNYSGKFLGTSNLRDLGELDHYGKRFVKHSGPINLPLYHVTNKTNNIIKALKYSKKEYSRFKKTFLDTASSLGYDGPIKEHVDLILKTINNDKVKSQPFYFSDMVASGKANKIEYTVLDKRTTEYPLTSAFNLDKLSVKSVLVYLEGVLLTHIKDYNFNVSGYITIDAQQQEGDKIEIYEYENTDGSFVAPTPTKLGLYPKYYPELTIDDTLIQDEPKLSGPFKVYGEDTVTGDRGWFYPVYTIKSDAGRGNASKSYTFVGMNKLFYIPTTGATLAGNDDIEVDEYPIGAAFIRGHDGSYVKAYKDFRDELLLELEKRIFNNIKAEYSTDRMDVNSFVGGEFRTNEFTRTEINNTLLGDFQKWLLDNLNNPNYTDNTFYDKNNNFTFNYSDTFSPNNNKNLGFWRGIYKDAFDTDRPHSHPWEMLGLTTKPAWWNTVYGPAPYTGDNLVLWKDLEAGKIADPANTRIDVKYARPGLSNYIPVNSSGKLLSPLDSGYIIDFNIQNTTRNFAFGDHTPYENSWRRSSEYPFAVLTAMVLNKPAKTMGLGFDTSRITKNLANQWTDISTNKPVVLKDLNFPNTAESDIRINTSGLVNYIYNLLASDILKVYNDYKLDVTQITNQMGIKIAGFTSKEKFNLILDSRSPTQSLTQDGIFVPQENYQVFLNTSSPQELSVYSGIVVERTQLGYVLRGYNLEKPYFEYYQSQAGSSYSVVNVGGISEKVVPWDSNTSYISGEVILHNNTYYRVITSFTSGVSFTLNDDIVKIPKLPLKGGRTAEFKKDFDTTTVKRLQYGTRLDTAQDVVDFILGYNIRQKEIGFSFENVIEGSNSVENWNSSAKEFLFWTTQGWANNSLIALSPAASLLEFERDYYVVDNIKDEFYGYNIFKADGLFLDSEFNSLLRDQNSFGIETIGTEEGLYHVALPLVQKEHVVLVDNTTDFNDTIYNPSTGYRQERIRVNGYRSDNWNGGLNIPGFVYDDATFTDWTQWKDYSIGDIVKYKQYYYVAINNQSGSQNFNATNWYQLNEKPESQLMTNFDYKVTQFTDFYDLDSDSFDISQQETAQLLIGYQKRQYLANIINDDVSQFKFYRGAIADKGTMNVFTKLFDALGNTTDNLEFYEEWAIQVGRYGAVDDVQQIEYNLKQDKMQESPQAVELVNTLPATNFDKIYRILPNEVFDKPADYDHAPFPTKTIETEYIKTSGYTNENDVDFIVSNLIDLSSIDANQISLGNTIWVTDTDNNSWSVMQLIKANTNANSLNTNIAELSDDNLRLVEITLDKWANGLFSAGDYISVRGAQAYGINGIYEIDSTNLNTVRIKVLLDNEIKDFEEEQFIVSKLRTIRIDNIATANNATNQDIYNNQKLWVDKYDSEWAVLENKSVYLNSQIITNPSDYDSTDQGFSDSVAVTQNNNNVFVAASNDTNGKISVYRRTREQSNLILDQEITIDNALFDNLDSNFGNSIAVSPDGEYLVAGIPQASDVKTRLSYKTDANTGQSTFDFQPDATYAKSDIVRYRESLWKANREILPQIGNQPFSTFDTYVNIASSADADSTELTLLVAGDPGLPNSTSSHLLVRAPKDMYIGTKIGDTVNLFWNQRSYAYPTLENFLPFDGNIPLITGDVISQSHTIAEKIDHVFLIDTFVSLPQIGNIVTTDTGSAEVAYVSSLRDSAVVYVRNTNGVFDVTGELFINELDFVGFYSEEETIATTDAVAGFWMINIGFNYSNNSTYYDVGRGLVYADVKLQDSERDLNVYYNIQNTVGSIGTFVTERNRASYIEQLSYRGDPAGADAVAGIERDLPSNKFVVRVGKTFSDGLTIGDDTEFRLYNLDNREIDLDTAGFTFSMLNKQQTIVDLWDGYINLELNEFDFSGFAFEPQVGDILEDVQVPRDGQGGLALTSITTSTAEVVFIKRNFNDVKVYLKILTGDWTEQSNIGRFNIRRKANVALRGSGDADRVIGIINDVNNDIVLGTSLVGKLLVFNADSNFSIVETPTILEEEYWFFDETTESGIRRFANPPYSLNKDYTQIYNVPADKLGSSITLPNEGAVAIYRRLRDGTYRFQNMLVSEYRAANRHFGSKVSITQVGNYYTLLIGTDSIVSANETDSTGRRVNPGSIEIFRHGTAPTDNFKGEYQLRAYSIGDIVIYKDDYYLCRKATTSIQNVIVDPIYWTNISWKHGKDSNYRGVFDNTYTYKKDNIVEQDNKLWRAVTNIAIDAAIPSSTNNSWTSISTDVDYVGYLPNLTANAFYDEDVFDPIENILEFSKSFDISNDAQVLVVTSQQSDVTSTTDIKLAIYRAVGDQFQIDQIISAPDNVTGWADKVAINPSGTQIAISSMLVDTNKINQGVVYVYTQTNGTFVLTQTLTPPQNEESEGFGFGLDFGTDNLVVSSLNGDQTIPTTFDITVYADTQNTKTTFDNNFTNFANIKLDKGVVYIYESVRDNLIYSEQFVYPLTQTTFGENIYANGNHVYIGMPDQLLGDSTKGQLIDFRKNKGVFAWNVISQGITPVDIDNIRGAFLYNKRKNEIVSYIDYIDPVQGKIAGPADQEITFKTPYDPAVYNTGNVSDSSVDPNRTWTDKHIGQVWWNIRSAKFTHAYQSSTTFQKNNWNKLAPGSRIDVYEWVESNFIPSIRDSIADTPDGIANGISGTSLFGDTRYSTKVIYDEISKTFSNKYFFWVVNSTVVPVMENRKLSIRDIAALIENPRTQGYPFISLLSKNKFVLNNFDTFVDNDELVLNIKYSTGPKKTQNLHSQYKLISDGLSASKPDPDIERKWFDSLIGFDTNERIVPDPTITVKNRYGIQNRPRQSMFANRFEALKQTIERINLRLSENLVVDEYDISSLSQKDNQPTLLSSEYDLVIDTLAELTFVSTNKISPARLEPVITNGRISRINIVDSGRGYKVAPSFKINGEGTDAEFETTINNLGQIISINATNEGSGYDASTSITVRPFTVLIKADESIQNKWALYSWNGTEWYRRKLQSYNVELYWDYVDWYATGYNQFTNINDTIKSSYQLPSLDNSINDTVKIETVGSGGWVLLRKINNIATEDYTINYETIGRENGTIKFKDTLYDYGKNTVGFDNRSFDSSFYDNNPSVELRIILEAIRDNIFVGKLEIEYNQLFMSALRYVMTEQQSVDWMFKTSFVKAKHNRESLNQKDITFNNDNLASYQDVVEEFKPYSTKVREFVSEYNAIDPTNSSISDFDLPPVYDLESKTIQPSKAIINNGNIEKQNLDTSTYPRKNWKDNHGYQITEIQVGDGGSGFTFEPVVTLVGGGGTGAKAKAYLGYGKITSIKVTYPGSGYTSAPTVVISGSQTETGTPAKATAVLGNGVVRSPLVKIKFDRISGTFTFDTLAKLETFTGTGFENRFFLEWPMNLDNKKVKVYVDNILQLRSKYTYENIKNTDKTYVREQGKVLFAKPPKLNSVIRIEYNIPISMLTAEDRIKFAYSPIAGMYGKDLAQLMSGVDYGGVEVRSFDFDGPAGFDTAPWYTDNWDEFDNTFEDEVFTADGSTSAVQLSAALEDGVVYNLYKNGVRIDDPNYYSFNPTTNVNAITNSITGDGVTDVILVQDLGISLLDGDVFVVRKTTSDGSVQPDQNSYDTALSGGNLAYTSARGISAEEIIVDGDGFVTPTTSSGPEEVVPGQILDTLDIKVYTRDGEGQGVINSQSYIMDNTVTYDLGVTPNSSDAIIVKVNNVVIPKTDYTINWAANTLTLDTATVGAELNIVTVAQGTQNILDFGKFVGDGSTTEFETTVDWESDTTVYASINGVQQTVVAFESETTSKTVIRFSEIVADAAIVNYTVFSADEQVNYSQITKDEFTGDGTNAVFTLGSAPLYATPTEHNTIVKVDGKILNPGYNIQYTIPQNSQREFSLQTFQMPAGSIAVSDLKIFLNGVEIFTPLNWRFELTNSSIILTDDTGVPGDLLEMYVITDGDYRITTNTVTLDTAPANNAKIEVIQFTNHDILGIERINYDVVSRTTLIPEDVDTVTYNRLTVGEITLRKPAVDAQYVWVSVNGELLSPSVDYYVSDDKLKIQLVKQPAASDVIDIIHFTAAVRKSKFAYRQFKDMLNRTHFKRLDKSSSKLSQPLNYYDIRIELEDASTLSEPNKGQNLPGVIFIEGERIEYFVKEENTLRQLRRGTLGTGVKNVYAADTKVFDQNISKTVPYKDNTLSYSATADGNTTVFEIGYPVTSINEIEVFVGGVRMRKNTLNVFNYETALDSPEADSVAAADFTFDADTNEITLLATPADDTKITVVKKTGQSWTTQGTSLGDTENSIGRFLRAGTSELPE